MDNYALDRKTLTLRLVSDKPFRGTGFAGRVTADVRVTLRRTKNPLGGQVGSSGVDVTPTPVRQVATRGAAGAA